METVSTEELNRQNKKLFRDSVNGLFNGLIKITFLMDCWKTVANDEFYRQLFDKELKATQDPAGLLTGYNPLAFETMKIITAIHRFNIYGLSDEEKGKRQNDPSYKEQLCNETLDEIKAMDFAPRLTDKKSFNLYQPPIYFSYVCAEFIKERLMPQEMAEALQKKYGRNGPLLRSMFIEMCQDIESIIMVMEIPAYPQAAALLRSLIDKYFSFSIIICHPEATNDYLKFLEYANYYDQNGEYPSEFIERYKECKSEKHIYIHNYLNYGWLESIGDYASKDDKTFVRSDFSFLFAMDDVTKTDLNKQYAFLSKFIHGSYFLGNYNVEDFPWFIIERIHII